MILSETNFQLFFLTTVTSELSKYLNEQLGVFLNVKQQKIKVAKNIKNGSLSKNFFVLM